MTPRPHQQQMLDATENGWKDGFRRQLAVCPTGGGKTPFFAWEAQKHLPGRTLILAHRDELINQAIDKVQSAIGLRAEKEKAEDFASLSARIVAGSVQTLCREARLNRWPADHFDLVVVDECHHALTPSYRVILDRFDKHAKVLGVTATPKRSDQRDLGEYFDNIAIQIPLYTRPDNPVPGLVNTGYLTPIAIQRFPVKIDLSGVGIAMDADTGCRDFKKADVASAIEPYLGEIAAEIKARASTRRVLAFAPLIPTAQKASEACAAVGLKSEFVYGEDPLRAEKLERFANWEYDILWNAQLLTEGYDDPGIDCILLLRPTRSSGFFWQVIGRGLRLDGPMKRDLMILDPLWLSETHKPVGPATLIATNEEEYEAIEKLIEKQSAALPADVAAQVPLDLQELAGTATKQREESLRKRLEEQKHKKGRFISAEEFALQHHNLEAAEFEPVVAWQKADITESQLKWLKRAHIDPATVRGKGHASVLLGVYFSNQKLQLASPAQRAKMRQMGHPSPDQATAQEARRFFAELRNK